MARPVWIKFIAVKVCIVSFCLCLGRLYRRLFLRFMSADIDCVQCFLIFWANVIFMFGRISFVVKLQTNILKIFVEKDFYNVSCSNL